jgi:hypothetical protein
MLRHVGRMTRGRYDIVTDHVTMDVMEVKYIPAVITLQRIFRGYLTRVNIMKLDMTVRKICRAWKTARFRRAVEEASAHRLAAVLRIQRCFRDKQVCLPFVSKPHLYILCVSA